MRTSATFAPSTWKRRALPGARSSTAHTRVRSPTTPPVLELVDDGAAQTASQSRHRQPREHVVEEAEHDESFGFLGRHAARFEVIELVLVDRADCRRVRAAHV